MVQLLKSVPQSKFITRFGGQPNAPATTDWPCCQHCELPMLFLGQVSLRETRIAALANRNQLLLLFQCNNNPGMCKSWLSEFRVNAALLVEEGCDPLTPPSEGVTALENTIGVEFVDYEEATDYDAAFKQFGETVYYDGEAYVGKIGGHALWVQNDQHPVCKCGAKMEFVLELIETGDMNFGGGGEAYAFVCADCDQSARLVWQC